MFGLDPLSRPVAIVEILLLLALAAFIGWLLGRLVLAGRIRSLRSSIADKEAELEACRRSKTQADTLTTLTAEPVAITTPVAAVPAVDMTQNFVHADPLLPVVTMDDTPDPIVELPPVEEPAADTRTVDTIAPEVPVAVPTGSPVEVVPEPVIPVVPAPVPSPVPVIAAAPVAPTPTPAAANSEAAVLNRIAARANEINFDRIGTATAAEADDLKDIVGIGPFLERKLHSLGIYTFRQVGNFVKEDINKVNDIIEFFPGRIERDNWVGQAKEFYQKKYGNREQPS